MRINVVQISLYYYTCLRSTGFRNILNESKSFQKGVAFTFCVFACNLLFTSKEEWILFNFHTFRCVWWWHECRNVVPAPEASTPVCGCKGHSLQWDSPGMSTIQWLSAIQTYNSEWKQPPNQCYLLREYLRLRSGNYFAIQETLQCISQL